MRVAWARFALSLGLGLWATVATTASFAETRVTLGSAQNTPGLLPIYVAQTKGLFADEGLKVEIFDFKGGAPTIQALVGGSIDFCACAADHAVRLRARGLPAKIVASLYEGHGYALLAKADAPVSNLASLKGKRIGITSSGSLTDNTIRFYLRQLQIDPDREATISPIGTGAAMKSALDAGAVDAGMFTTPDAEFNLGDAGKYKIVQDFRGLTYPSLELIATETWLSANDATAKAFVRAIVRAQDLIQADPAALRAGILAMSPNVTPAVVDILMAEVPKHLAQKGHVSDAGFATMIEMLGAIEPALKTVPMAEVVTPNYLPVR